MQGIVHSFSYLELVTLPHAKPWEEPVGFPFQPPYKGRGVMLGLWGLTEELDEAAQIGRDSQTGGKAFIPLALWLGTGT